MWSPPAPALKLRESLLPQRTPCHKAHRPLLALQRLRPPPSCSTLLPAHRLPLPSLLSRTLHSPLRLSLPIATPMEAALQPGRTEI